MKKWILFKLIVLAFCPRSHGATKTLAQGQSLGHGFRLVQVADGLPIPWGMAFLNGGSLLVGQKSGVLSLVETSTGRKTTLKGGPQVFEQGQGGFLDLRRHPNYPKEPWIYATWVQEKSGQGVTTLSRFKIRQNQIQSWTDLLVTQSASRTGRHFGSRITFDDKGFVYFSVGDRGVRPNGQDRSTHAGSIMRLHLDGRIPKDNPFVKNKNMRPEIWSFGHRNPQGLSFEKQTGTLWAMEHGPRGGDEINIIQRSKNYGWPVVSYGREYNRDKMVGEAREKPGMVSPYYQFTPSIAPCGLEVYSGQLFPQWRGHLFSGALALTHLNQISKNPQGKIQETRLLRELGWRVRNVRESPEGYLYIASDRGLIARLEPLAKK